jgi:hypothetical protein
MLAYNYNFCIFALLYLAHLSNALSLNDSFLQQRDGFHRRTNGADVKNQTLLTAKPSSDFLEASKEQVSSEINLIHQLRWTHGNDATHCSNDHQKHGSMQSTCFGRDTQAVERQEHTSLIHTAIHASSGTGESVEKAPKSLGKRSDDYLVLSCADEYWYWQFQRSECSPTEGNIYHTLCYLPPSQGQPERKWIQKLACRRGLMCLETPSTNIPDVLRNQHGTHNFVAKCVSPEKWVGAFNARSQKHNPDKGKLINEFNSLFQGHNRPVERPSSASSSTGHSIAKAPNSLGNDAVDGYWILSCEHEYSRWLFGGSRCSLIEPDVYATVCYLRASPRRPVRLERQMNRCRQGTLCVDATFLSPPKGQQGHYSYGHKYALHAKCVPHQKLTSNYHAALQEHMHHMVNPSHASSNLFLAPRNLSHASFPRAGDENPSKRPRFNTGLQKRNRQIGDLSHASSSSSNSEQPSESLVKRDAHEYWILTCEDENFTWDFRGSRCSVASGDVYFIQCSSRPSQGQKETKDTQKGMCRRGLLCVNTRLPHPPEGQHGYPFAYAAKCVSHEKWVSNLNTGIQGQSRHLGSPSHASSSTGNSLENAPNSVGNEALDGYWILSCEHEYSRWLFGGSKCSLIEPDVYVIVCYSRASQGRPAEVADQKLKCRQGTMCVDVPLLPPPSGMETDFHGHKYSTHAKCVVSHEKLISNSKAALRKLNHQIGEPSHASSSTSDSKQLSKSL